MKIVIDTREQNPLTFRASETLEGTIIKGLRTGDYSIEGYEHLIAFERKSPEDLIQTVTGGNERFQKELRRATQMEFFAIIVEAPYTEVRDGHYFGKVKPYIALETMWTLVLKYGIHVFFTKDRTESAAMIRAICKKYVQIKEKKETYTLGDDLDMIRKIQKLRKKVILR